MEIDLRQTVHQSGAYKMGLGPSSPTLRNKGNVLYNDALISLFTVIWRHT